MPDTSQRAPLSPFETLFLKGYSHRNLRLLEIKGTQMRTSLVENSLVLRDFWRSKNKVLASGLNLTFPFQEVTIGTKNCGTKNPGTKCLLRSRDKSCLALRSNKKKVPTKRQVWKIRDV